MTASEILRLVIIGSASIVSALWIVYAARRKRWSFTVIALSWLVPVAALFVLRYWYNDYQVINLISLAMYLNGIFILGAMAILRLRGRYV